MTGVRELRTEWGEIRTEQMPFRSQGVDLWGTVTLPLPKRAPRLPGVVLVHGPAAVDGDYTFPRMRLALRSGNLEPEEPPARDWAIKPFKEIGECLAAGGFIVLRYDKRGAGRSGGSQREWTLDLLAADVVAALALLKARRDIDPDRLFLLGHSEGGVIATLLAGELGYLRGLARLAAPVTPLPRLALQQTEHLLRLEGCPEERIAAHRRQMEADFERMHSGASREQPYGETPIGHWRSLMRHKPLIAMRRIPAHTPVLLVSGGKDWQVPPSEALSAYRALQAEAHPDIELHVFPELDHFLLEEPGVSRPETYFAHRRHLPRYLLQTLQGWFTRQVA